MFIRPNETVVKLAERLVSVMRKAGCLPKSAEKGYWPTLRLLWDDARIEVEVFEEVYELYFLPASDEAGTFSIWEYDAADQCCLEKLSIKIRELLSP